MRSTNWRIENETMLTFLRYRSVNMLNELKFFRSLWVGGKRLDDPDFSLQGYAEALQNRAAHLLSKQDDILARRIITVH
jgi:hypothetical protein